VIISPQQMRQLDDRAFDGFVARLVPFVRRRCGAAGAFDPGLVPADEASFARQVRAGALRARALGLRSERALAAYVALACSYAPEFDSHPGVRAALEDRRYRPDERIRRVFDTIVRAEARRRGRSTRA
jgi:hypothetical protein